jgi:hypothetical protein
MSRASAFGLELGGDLGVEHHEAAAGEHRDGSRTAVGLGHDRLQRVFLRFQVKAARGDYAGVGD